MRAAGADADSEEVEQTLSVLHEPDYLEALGEVSEEPVVMPELTPPGLPPDIPVCAGLVEAAREGVRTAMTAAERLADGARFTYALCRPPGHHAGPAWFAGYCYLNTAAAAVQTLREARRQPGRHPRHRPALPERHRGDRRDDGRTPACTRCTPRR